MRERLYCFLVVLLLMFQGNVFSQEKDSLIALPSFTNPVFDKKEGIRLNKEGIRLNRVSPDFYVSHLGFFCRKELQIEKTTSIPFLFRLGSSEYTNYLEQKPNARKPGN